MASEKSFSFVVVDSASSQVKLVSRIKPRESMLKAPGYEVYEVDDRLIPENPTAHLFDGDSTWTPVRSFHVEVARVLGEISTTAERALAILKRGYTQNMIETWPQQRSEAEAYMKDASAEVTTLKGMSERRNISLEELVNRVNKKVRRSAEYTSIIMGDFHAAEDKIDDLKSLSDSDQLPDDWFEQLQDIAANWQAEWPEALKGA